MYTDLALHIDGQWLNGDGRAGEDVINPATEKPLGKLPHASTADLDRALEAAKKGFEVWRNTPAYERSKVLRKAASLVRERADKIGADHDPGAGQGPRRGAARSPGHRRHHRLVRGGGPPQLRPHRAGPPEERAADGDAGAGRRGRGVHAVEFPDAHAGAQDRRRAGRRLLADPEGLGRDAGKLRRAGALRDRGRRAAGRAQSRVRRAGESVRAPDPVADRAQGVVHRLDPGRQASRRARRQGRQAHHAGARRPLAGRRVRRRRSGKDRRHHRGVQVPQRRAGLHLADALLCAGAGLRPLRQALHRLRQQHQARRRAGGRHHHGADGEFAPARRARKLRQRRQEPRRQDRHRRQAARQPGLLSSSRRWSPTSPTTPR